MDDDEEDNAEGYVAFEGRKVKAVLYKLAPMTDALKQDMTAYVHDGFMMKDERFAREVFGQMNASGKRDYTDFYESPWVEEHVRETGKRKRLNMMQKTAASRTFMKAVVAQETQDVEKYIHTADKLREWEEQRDEDEDVKTVSRTVQSFERIAMHNIMLSLSEGWAIAYANAKVHLQRLKTAAQKQRDDETSVLCHSVRRCDALYHVFAHTVSMEMVWADATNGSKNTSIYMCKTIELQKSAAIRQFVQALDGVADAKRLPVDTMGIPLMRVNKNMCVSSNGVLVVGKDSTDVVYVLDMITGFDARGKLDLTDVKSIQITQVFSEKDDEAMKAVREKERSRMQTRSQRAARLLDLAL
jgi:hypothetical protein